MIYKFQPIKYNIPTNIVSLDGYTSKDNLIGPFRKDNAIMYYDPLEGKLLDPKINCYVGNNTNANLYVQE